MGCFPLDFWISQPTSIPSALCPGVEKTSLRMYFPHWLPSQKFSRIQGCSCKSPYGVWEHVLQTSGYYTPSRNHNEQCRLFLPPESNKENGNEIIEEERDRRRRVRFFQRLLRTRQMRWSSSCWRIPSSKRPPPDSFCRRSGRLWWKWPLKDAVAFFHCRSWMYAFLWISIPKAPNTRDRGYLDTKIRVWY